MERSTDPGDSRLEELLLTWEERRGMGESPSIEDLCGDCPELAAELRRRIALLEAWGRFQNTPEKSHPAATSRISPEPPNSPGLTMSLDRYEILEQLGAGGMGVVYKARHLTMGRTVALKVLSQAALDSPEKVRRFRHEVRAVAQLAHINIVSAHDAGEAKGIPFLVMEFVDGEDLARLVSRRGPLPVPDTVASVIQAARALQHAHEEGIIHRDVKPSNLMRTANGTIKLLDLGLARARAELTVDGESATSSQELTTENRFLGTASYTSPEQGLDSRQVDPRTDIYSLGCTLYYLLTGHPPYRNEGLMSTLLAHREAPIPSLSASRPDVPPALDVVYRRMVAKSPDDRYQSMSEVITALEDLVPSVPRDESGSRFDAGPETEDEPRPEARAITTTLASQPTPGPIGRRPRSWWPAAVLLPIILLALAPIVIRLKTSAGTLVVEIDQPGAEVTVDEGKVRIITPDDREPVEIEVARGDHLLTVRKGNFESHAERFTLSARQRKIIAVHLEPVAEAMPNSPSASTSNTDRDIALWILKRGGEIKVSMSDRMPRSLNELGTLPDIRDQADLPSSPFRLARVVFRFGDCTDEDLTRLETVKTLCSIWVAGSPITDRGLRCLGRLTNLLALQLDWARVTDEGLGALKNLTRLQSIYLTGTPLHGTGLSQLAELPLKELVIGSLVDDAGMRAIGRLPHLERLDLDSDKISDDSLRYLGGLRLRAFLLTAKQVTDRGLEVLRSWTDLDYLRLSAQVTSKSFEYLEKHKSLWFLEIDSPNLMFHDLLQLKPIPSLTDLHLHGGGFNDSGLESLRGLPSVKRLGLQSTRVSDVSAPELSRLAGIEVLDLTGTQVTNAGLRQLKNALPRCEIFPTPIDDVDRAAAEWVLRTKSDGNGVTVRVVRTSAELVVRRIEELPTERFHLVSVDLWGERTVDDLGMRNLEGLQHLQNLGLYGTSVGSEGARMIANIPSVKALDLHGTRIEDVASGLLTRLSQLETLILTDTLLSDEGLRALSPLKKLKEIDIAKTFVTENGLKHLNYFPQLSSVGIDSLAITDEGLKSLRLPRTLTRLSANDTGITAQGVRWLAEQSPRLEDLCIGAPSVKDDALEALEKLKFLTVLHLQRSHVTDAGMAAIARLRRLRVLNLEDTAITDTGLHGLSELALEDLNVTRTLTTSEGRNAFRLAHPKCRVFPED